MRGGFLPGGLFLVAIASACGENGGGQAGRSDGGGTDRDANAPIDGSMEAYRPPPCALPADDAPLCGPAAETERLTVLTYPGITVLLHDADGCVSCRTQADESGIAVGPLPDGGMATVVGEKGAFTVGALAPGETVRIGRPLPIGDVQSIRIEAPALAGAVAYEAVMHGCDRLAYRLPFNMRAKPECLDADGTTSIFVEARDSANQPIAYGWIPDVMIAPGGGTIATVPEWVPADREITASISGTPDDLSALFFVAGYVDRQMYACDPCNEYSAGGGDREVTVMLPVIDAEASAYQLYLARDAFDGDSISRVVDSLPASIAIDVASDFLPPVTSAAGDGEERRPVLRWTTEAPPTESDLLLLQVGWYAYRWSFALPPDTASPAAFPDLPSDLQRPPPIEGPVLVVYGDVSAISSWQVVRRDVYAAVDKHLVWSSGPIAPGWSWRTAQRGVFDFHPWP